MLGPPLTRLVWTICLSLDGLPFRSAPVPKPLNLRCALSIRSCPASGRDALLACDGNLSGVNVPVPSAFAGLHVGETTCQAFLSGAETIPFAPAV